MSKNHSILMIVEPNEYYGNDLKKYFFECDCEIVEASALDVCLERVQQKKFDVIILDAEIRGMQIDRFINILKEIDSAVKIIVKAKTNSKDLEAKIRKAKVFYYHLDLFGAEELKLAIKSALENKVISKRLSVSSNR